MHYDIAILGGGFGGSISALVAKQLGMEAVLIEKSTLPRFAIGESSTPQADIMLDFIGNKYNLPQLKPFATYGAWKNAYPNILCGPKRGFTYINHLGNKEELLVAANPNQHNADTHWHRASFDAFLVEEIKKAGIAYYDNTNPMIKQGDPWIIEANAMECTASFIIDATGGSNPLNIEQENIFQTNTRALYSHFKHVCPWGQRYAREAHPYPCHESALHHLIDGGWMYVLHFDQGITSAGFILKQEKYPLNNSEHPQDEWNRLMQAYPDIHWQFNSAEQLFPITQTKRLQRSAKHFAGNQWGMLPNAAYCIDPLHSTGNAHTLHCICRLLETIHAGESLELYTKRMRQEATMIDQLVSGSYACMNDFESFTNFVMLYFAGADFSERNRRDGIDVGFMNSNDQNFKQIISHWSAQAMKGHPIPNLADEIEPWNLAGLCDPSKQNMYDYA